MVRVTVTIITTYETTVSYVYNLYKYHNKGQKSVWHFLDIFLAGENDARHLHSQEQQFQGTK